MHQSITKLKIKDQEIIVSRYSIPTYDHLFLFVSLQRSVYELTMFSFRLQILGCRLQVFPSYDCVLLAGACRVSATITTQWFHSLGYLMTRQAFRYISLKVQNMHIHRASIINTCQTGVCVFYSFVFEKSEIIIHRWAFVTDGLWIGGEKNE